MSRHRQAAESGGSLEFWQREAARYDSASRALIARMRTEIALGVTALSSVVALAVVNQAYAFLVGVPVIAAAVWGMALWSVQESFLLDAHLMYAESQVDRELGAQGGMRYPVWASHGGRVGRFGYVLHFMYGSWGLVTLTAVGSCIFFAWVRAGELAMAQASDRALLIILIVEAVVFVVTVGIGAITVERAGSRQFTRFAKMLEEQPAPERWRRGRAHATVINPLSRRYGRGTA